MKKFLLFTFASLWAFAACFAQNEGTNDETQTTTDDTQVTVTFADVVKDIKVNGYSLVYDKTAPAYYCTLPAATMADESKSFTATVSIETNAGYDDYVLSTFAAVAPNTEGKVTVSGIDCTTAYSISVDKPQSSEAENGGSTNSLVSNTYELTIPLYFTYLPLVEVFVDIDQVNADKYVLGQMRVCDADFANYAEAAAPETMYARFKYRGNYALTLDKKNFAVKTCDENEKGVDRSFFGYRNDNNWILDAAAFDQSNMRNKVSMDLWNDFARDPYYVRNGDESAEEVHTGTRGRFVEVFINNAYQGLYVLSEKTDRKQLKLKKLKEEDDGSLTIRGLLYKGDTYNINTQFGFDRITETFNNPASEYDNSLQQETWGGFEIKYPDWEEEPLDWKPMYDAINFVSLSTDEVFAADVDKYFVSLRLSAS